MACCGTKPSGIQTKLACIPKYKAETLAEKFYSRNNTSVEEQLINQTSITEYEQKIQQYRKYDARCAYKLPRYTNQTYGWLPGYKICFLQSCDMQICDHPAILNAIKNMWKQNNSEDKKPLPTYNYCGCMHLYKKRSCLDIK